LTAHASRVTLLIGL